MWKCSYFRTCDSSITSKSTLLEIWVHKTRSDKLRRSIAHCDHCKQNFMREIGYFWLCAFFTNTQRKKKNTSEHYFPWATSKIPHHLREIVISVSHKYAIFYLVSCCCQEEKTMENYEELQESALTSVCCRVTFLLHIPFCSFLWLYSKQTFDQVVLVQNKFVTALDRIHHTIPHRPSFFFFQTKQIKGIHFEFLTSFGHA